MLAMVGDLYEHVAAGGWAYLLVSTRILALDAGWVAGAAVAGERYVKAVVGERIRVASRLIICCTVCVIPLRLRVTDKPEVLVRYPEAGFWEI